MYKVLKIEKYFEVFLKVFLKNLKFKLLKSQGCYRNVATR